MGFILLIFLVEFSGQTTGQECYKEDYKVKDCTSEWNGWFYNAVRCSIPEDLTLAEKQIYKLSSCLNWRRQNTYTVMSGSVQVWEGCRLQVTFCLKREATINTMKTSLTPTIPVETIPDVTSSTLGTSYEDTTRNLSNTFSYVDFKIQRHKDTMVINVGIAVGGIILAVLSASIFCFLRKRRAKAQSKIRIQRRSVENINYMYFSDNEKDAYGKFLYLNSHVNGNGHIPVEDKINVHKKGVVIALDHVSNEFNEDDDYNRICFSGKTIIPDPTYNHTASVLAGTGLYYETENRTSEFPYFLDTEYSHTFLSRDNTEYINTCSAASVNVSFDDKTYDNLGEIQMTNIKLQAEVRAQTTSDMNMNHVNNDTSINDTELNIYVNVNFN